MSSPNTVVTYEIDREKLIQLGGGTEDVLFQLYDHLEDDENHNPNLPDPIFPSTFYVKIEVGFSITYYETRDCLNPFVRMGIMNRGFKLVQALMMAIGKHV
jgi:hypothetical protein